MEEVYSPGEKHWSKEFFLLCWQQEHQQLTPQQQTEFLNHISTDQILLYPAWAISKLLPEHKKLDSLRAALWNELFPDAWQEFEEITPEDLGMAPWN